MSSVLYYEPFYLDRLVNNVFSGCSIPTTATATAAQKLGGLDAAIKSLKPIHPTECRHRDVRVPGVSKEDVQILVQINLHAGKLVVSAETKQSEEHAGNGYAVQERRFGKYSRTVQLPQGIKEKEVKASMENGILTVTFPKLTPELAPKRISIS